MAEPKPNAVRRVFRRMVRPNTGQNLTLPIVLAVPAIVLGIIGWTSVLYDGSLKSIIAIIIRVGKSFTLSADSLSVRGNRVTDIATLLAVLTTVMGATILTLALLGEALVKLLARTFARNHAVVVGDTPIARRIASLLETQSLKVLHAVPPSAPRTLADGPARLRLELDAKNLVEAARLKFARMLFVDLASDAANLRSGAAIIQHLVSERKNRTGAFDGPEILSMAVSDGPVATQSSSFLDLVSGTSKSGAPSVIRTRATILDENLLIARAALRSFPLFEFAKRAGQSGVHGLIVGFGSLGEMVMDQIFLTSVAKGLANPKVTILDANAAACERRFRAVRPNVLDQLDIRFLDIGIGVTALEEQLENPATSEFLARDRASPITAIFLCLPSDAGTLEAVLLLRRAATRSGHLNAPIFYRWREPMVGEAFPSADDGSSTRLVRMQLDDATLIDEIVRAGTRDRLAAAQHAVYQKLNKDAEAAAYSWADLPDALRRENVRVADHLPAKLWSAGVPLDVINRIVEPTYGEPDRVQNRQPLQDAIRLLKEQEPMIARLEHERWCVERKLDGWRYGPARDDAQKLHPSLVSWDSLLNAKGGEIAKTNQQVEALLVFLADNTAIGSETTSSAT